MGRRPRVHFLGACYHAIVRGNNRQRLFLSESDRIGFLALVAEGVERFGHQMHAYCLMTNHVHLAVQVGAVPLSKIIHNLSFRFARRMHKSLGRSGHFFERRYRARLIETDKSLLNVVRYIHRNPVEAGLVDTPGSYPWSSHRAYLTGDSPSWLTTEMVLRLCAKDEQAARAELARLVAGEPLPGDDSWNPERLLADVELAPTSRSPLPSMQIEGGIEDVIAAVAQIAGTSPQELQGPSRRRPVARARALAAMLVRDHSNLSLRELAEHLERSPSTISCLASRAERLAPAGKLRREIQGCLQLLGCR